MDPTTLKAVAVLIELIDKLFKIRKERKEKEQESDSRIYRPTPGEVDKYGRHVKTLKTALGSTYHVDLDDSLKAFKEGSSLRASECLNFVIERLLQEQLSFIDADSQYQLHLYEHKLETIKYEALLDHQT